MVPRLKHMRLRFSVERNGESRFEVKVESIVLIYGATGM